LSCNHEGRCCQRAALVSEGPTYAQHIVARHNIVLHSMVLCKQKPEEPMAKHDSVTKRHRRPKSAKRADYTARTMAAIKELEQAAKLKVK
jgi:hypothetical protein